VSQDNHSYFKDRRWLIVPIEVKAREFESRMLLSCFAAKAGFAVLLGKQSLLLKHVDKLPAGVYFDKSISPNKYRKLVARNESGIRTVVIDEEGLGWHPGFFYVRPRLSNETVSLTSLICCWGQQDAGYILEHFPDAEGKLVTTGNPRVDLWRPEFRSIYETRMRDYQEAYGPYILIPTNFAPAINANGDDYLLKEARRRGRFKSQADEQHFLERVQFTKRNYEGFVDLIPHLAERFPDNTIIIRPHHAERQSAWLSFQDRFPNVEVIYEGNVTPWILGASCIVHHGCNTGAEGFLMGKAVISYQPYPDTRFDADIGHTLSVATTDENELMTLVEQAISGHYQPNSNAMAAAAMAIASLEGEFSCERIIKAIEQHVPVQADTLTRKMIRHGGFSGLPRRLSRSLRDGLRKLTRNDSKAARRAYSTQKYPGIRIDEVEQLLGEFAGVRDDFKSLVVDQLMDDVYCIHDNSASS